MLQLSHLSTLFVTTLHRFIWKYSEKKIPFSLQNFTLNKKCANQLIEHESWNKIRWFYLCCASVSRNRCKWKKNCLLAHPLFVWKIHMNAFKTKYFACFQLLTKKNHLKIYGIISVTIHMHFTRKSVTMNGVFMFLCNKNHLTDFRCVPYNRSI